MFGFETSMIGVCGDKRSSCRVPVNVDGSEQPCWLVLSKKASEDADRLVGRQREDGEYWIEGSGRIAVRPGGFGHLGAYTCQVEMQAVRAFEEGPPWLWALPPAD